MIIDMLNYYNMIKSFDIDIIYSGPLWADGIEGIAETLKKRLEFDDLSLTSTYSVFSVFVEQMNNMLLYSAEKEQFEDFEHKITQISKGVFVLGVKDKKYFLQSGNIIKNDNIELIKNRIDHLNTLDKLELRKYYKEQIKNVDSNKESKGAGLGLIEIARRSNSKIEYNFTPQDDGLSFFSMYVAIG